MDEWARAEIELLKRRVAALEQQSSPSTVPAAEAPPARPEADPELVELVRRGKALEAIHAYVNKTGADLATAKAEVARIAASLSPTDFVS